MYGETEKGDPNVASGPQTKVAGRLYADGSCSSNVFRELRRAGSSLIHREHGGQVTWRARLPVCRPLQQTPQSAEFATLAIARYMIDIGRAADVASDCLNVLRDVNAVGLRAMIGRRVHAGLVREVKTDLNWARHVEVRKVKAHQSIAVLPPGPQREDAIGNDWADDDAKEAAKLHPRPSPAMEQDLQAQLKRAKIILRTIAKVMQTFSPMPADKWQRAPAAREGAVMDASGGHQCHASGRPWGSGQRSTCLRIWCACYRGWPKGRLTIFHAQ